MTFLESLGVSTPAELHSIIDRSAKLSPAVDQFEAETNEARRLAPHNRFLRLLPQVQFVIHQTLRTIGESEAGGTAQLIRYSAYGRDSTAYTRDGSVPVPANGVVRPCHTCNRATALVVPFWIACGQYIVQIDACGLCADSFIFDGAVPQVTRSEG